MLFVWIEKICHLPSNTLHTQRSLETSSGRYGRGPITYVVCVDRQNLQTAVLVREVDLHLHLETTCGAKATACDQRPSLGSHALVMDLTSLTRESAAHRCVSYRKPHRLRTQHQRSPPIACISSPSTLLLPHFCPPIFQDLAANYADAAQSPPHTRTQQGLIDEVATIGHADEQHVVELIDTINLR